MARRYLKQEGRVLRDDYKLRSWFESDDEIRQRYFTWIRNTIDDLQLEDADPPDETVVNMMAGMCESDPSLNSHIGEQNLNPIPWKELRETAAGMVFELYLRETEARTWP